MNRRNFFRTVTGFIAGICAAAVPKAKATEPAPESTVGTEGGLKDSPRTNVKIATEENPSEWKFYINNEEVDSSRVVDRNGALRWPFKGAKKGDVCTVKNLKIFI